MCLKLTCHATSQQQLPPIMLSIFFWRSNFCWCLMEGGRKDIPVGGLLKFWISSKPISERFFWWPIWAATTSQQQKYLRWKKGENKHLKYQFDKSLPNTCFWEIMYVTVSINYKATITIETTTAATAAATMN